MTAVAQRAESIIDERRALAPLRICFIADPRSIHTVRWIRFFAERGHEVALVSQHLPAHGLEVAAFYKLSERSPLPATRIIRNVAETRRAIRDFRPDVLHAHYINECGWLGALSGFHPFALTAWGSDVYLATAESRLARRLTPWSVRRADYVTADSNDQLDRLRQMGASPDRCEMITWGVDLPEFTNRDGSRWRRAYGIEPDKTVVLSPRQWIDNSNIDVIVEAFARARASRSDLTLVLKRMASTQGDVKRRIEAQVSALGIADSTVIVEEMPADELPAMYAAADVTVSVCSSDGTPVSVLEAMASGSAVIAGRLPSLAQWIDDSESGLLVAPGDSHALARAMLLLASDPELRRRLARSGRAVIERRADRTGNFEKVERAYRRLAAPALA